MRVSIFFCLNYRGRNILMCVCVREREKKREREREYFFYYRGRKKEDKRANVRIYVDLRCYICRSVYLLLYSYECWRLGERKRMKER